MVLSSPLLTQQQQQQQQQSASHWLDHQSQANTAKGILSKLLGDFFVQQSLYNHRPRHHSLILLQTDPNHAIDCTRPKQPAGYP